MLSHRLLFGAVLAATLFTQIQPARASILTLAAGELNFEISPGLSITDPAISSPEIFVSSGAGGFELPAGLFPFEVETVFTGIGGASTFNVTAPNGTGNFGPGAGGGGGFGGTMPLAGNAMVGLFGGGVNLVIPMSILGSGGAEAVGAALLMVTVTGHLWTTGSVQITDVTVGGLSGQTATIEGADDRTTAHRGTLLLVAPFRIITVGLPHFPAFVGLSLTFVPEPGGLLLLVTAGLAIAWGARRR